MDKQQLLVQISTRLQADLEVNMEAANEAREAAIHDESVPETQYDTIGLEASYLAHGQSKGCRNWRLIWPITAIWWSETSMKILPPDYLRWLP